MGKGKEGLEILGKLETPVRLTFMTAAVKQEPDY